MRRSPDERLRTAADCLSRLRVLGPDPIPMHYGSQNVGNNSKPLFEEGTGPGLEPVGDEFQPSFLIAYPAGGAHLFSILHSIFVLNKPRPLNDHEPPSPAGLLLVLNRFIAIPLVRIKRLPAQKRQVAGSPRKTMPTTAVKTTSLDMKTPPSQPLQ
jgi:hypothetical protein